MEQLELLKAESLPNRVRSISDLTAEEENTVIDRARDILASRIKRGQGISNIEETKAYLQIHLGDRLNEVFGVVYLDNRHRVLAFEELFFGSIAGATIHPRVVVQRALYHNAAAVIFTHNHPSGVAEPSDSDKAITRRLQEALGLVDVRTLDHVIVSAEETVSFAERGLL